MTIEFRNESILSLAAAARMLPPGRRGRPVSLSCILRWIVDGVKLRSGETVRLEGFRLGGRWLTSIEALERFAARQTPDPVDRHAAMRPPAGRQRASARAQRELEKIGM
jgi:hypothetical protein